MINYYLTITMIALDSFLFLYYQGGSCGGGEFGGVQRVWG
jgi:hypothetical protein